MRILITGGTGFIGSELIKHLSTHQIVLLTRKTTIAKQKILHADLGNIQYINDLKELNTLNDIDAVINLAGEPIAGNRWTDKQKKAICNSRWNITEQLVSLIHASASPPDVLISGSAVGYYGDQQSHPFDETLNSFDGGFTHHVCSAWESIARKAQTDVTRVCVVRTGLVLGTEGGALPMMLPAFKYGLGSQLGNGSQYMPWIHILDMVRGILFLLETNHAAGSFNFSAPHPVTNKQFSKALATTLNKPLFLSTPQFFFKLIMGEASCLLFDSIRAKPKHLTELGFNFTYSRIKPALNSLLKH